MTGPNADLATIHRLQRLLRDKDAEIARLTQERDEAEKRASDSHEVMIRVYARAEAAERALADVREALRPFVEEYDFHAADYLAERVDGEEARVFTARTVESLIEHQVVARRVLAAPQEPQP